MTKRRTNEHGLTEKEEKFCLEYIKNGGNASAAYRASHDVGANTKESSVNSQSCIIRARKHVSARIESLLATAAAGRGMTVESLVDEYAEAYRIAKEIGQPSAMVQATKAKQELLGLAKKILVHEGPDGEPLQPAIIQLVAPGYIEAIDEDDENEDEDDDDNDE